MRNVFRKKNVFLVELDEMVVLVDQEHGVMHAVNPAGAAAWCRLGERAVDEDFVARLRELDLVADTDQGASQESYSRSSNGAPAILRSNMLLQVAASRPMHRGGWF